MTRLVLLLVLLAPLPAFAQFPSVSLPCGGAVTPYNASFDIGNNGWLEYTVSTIAGYNVCTRGMIATGRVAGIPNSQATDAPFWNWFAASVRRQVPVPWTARWATEGDHAFYLSFPCCVPWSAGKTLSAAWVTVQTQADLCYAQGPEYYWDGQSCQFTPGSPLIVALDGGPIRMTSRADGVLFDLDGDGEKEQVSWTEAGVRVAWIVKDRNRNGRIDSGQELFGTATPVGYDALLPSGYATTFNGFEALSYEEQVGAVEGLRRTLPDRKIAADDPAYRDLQLWIDLDHNGETDKGELQSLDAAGLIEISLQYHELDKQDKHGNRFLQAAPARFTHGKTTTPTLVYDVWLVTR